jgi:hypothetical protein
MVMSRQKNAGTQQIIPTVKTKKNRYQQIISLQGKTGPINNYF